MKKLFRDLLEIEGVQGVLYFSSDGKILYKEFLVAPASDLDSTAWSSFVAVFSDVKEAEFVYDTRWLYLRRSNGGIVLVIMALASSVAMVRLNCDIILPSLGDAKKASKGLGRFFK